MKTILVFVAAILTMPMHASAQTATHNLSWQGYGLFGVGWEAQPPGRPTSFAPQIAVGTEIVSAMGVGVGLEMGWTWTQFPAAWLKTPSLDLSYHFPKVAHKRVEPFVQVGPTLMFNGTVQSRGGVAVNFAGGINYWFSRHVALRCEFKDFAQPSYYHYLNYPSPREFRVGVTVR